MTDPDIDYRGLIKALRVPPGFVAPQRLTHGDLVARALSRDDLEADVAGINASVEIIRATRGGGWPERPVTEEEDYVDLVWHELEHRESYSFSYALYEHDDRYVGCCYLYPLGRRTPLSAALLDRDVDVSWWVTSEASDRGLYSEVYRALQRWVVEDFPFSSPHWSNIEVPDPGS